MAAFKTPAPQQSAKAFQSLLSNLAVQPSGSSVEDDKLHDATKWLAARYPRLFPLQRTEVGIRDPGAGNDGFTNPMTGAISIRPGMSPEKVAATLVHEMLHSRVGSRASRLKQGADQLLRGSAEHDFLGLLDQVILNHALLEMQLGRAVDSAELLFLAPISGTLEYEEKGAPTVIHQLARLPNSQQIEYRLPSWSAVRASFERESHR